MSSSRARRRARRSWAASARPGTTATGGRGPAGTPRRSPPDRRAARAGSSGRGRRLPRRGRGSRPRAAAARGLAPRRGRHPVPPRRAPDVDRPLDQVGLRMRRHRRSRATAPPPGRRRLSVVVAGSSALVGVAASRAGAPGRQHQHHTAAAHALLERLTSSPRLPGATAHVTLGGMAALSRRSFLARSSIAALGAAACSDGGDREAAAEPAATPAFDPADWASVRDQFALDPDVRPLRRLRVRLASPAGARGHRPPPRRARRRHRRLPRRRPRPTPRTAVRARGRPSTSAPSPAEVGAHRQHHDGPRRRCTAASALARGRRGAHDRARLLLHPRGAAAAGRARRARRCGGSRLYDDPAAADASTRSWRGSSPAVTPADPRGGGDLGALGHRGEAAGRRRSPTRSGERRPRRDRAGAAVRRRRPRPRRRGRRRRRPGLRLPRRRHPQVAVRPARHRHRLGPAARRGAAVDAAIPPFEPAQLRRLDAGRPPAGPPGCGSRPAATTRFEHRWALAEAFRFHLDIGRGRGGRAHRRAGDPAQGGAGRGRRA